MRIPTCTWSESHRAACETRWLLTILKPAAGPMTLVAKHRGQEAAGPTPRRCDDTGETIPLRAMGNLDSLRRRDHLLGNLRVGRVAMTIHLKINLKVEATSPLVRPCGLVRSQSPEHMWCGAWVRFVPRNATCEHYMREPGADDE